VQAQTGDGADHRQDMFFCPVFFYLDLFLKSG
jgi:hypothetical protein